MNIWLKDFKVGDRNMKMYGKRVWFFPDGDRPPMGDSPLKGHESIIILNPNKVDSRITITLYFTDKEPVRDIQVYVAAERVKCIQTHKEEDFGVHVLPLSTQYAMKLESDTPVIVQYGRLDSRQSNLAYYTTMGYGER
ncbi:MAG: sensory rhodopsin transducer [Mahellales bacterium]